MIDFKRSKLANKYIFFEMLPSFLMGVLIFIFIILMFQSFRLMEYVIVHGASATVILKILFYLTISFLPVIFPMSLLFAVLLTYGRLSNDSEIVALKALGLNINHLTLPALILAGLTAMASAQTSFYLAPWGNRQMEILVHKLGQSKPGAAIREGVFSEGFFDMVVYANEVNSKDNFLKKIFIYDERGQVPLTIIAKEGKLVQESSLLGNKAFLRLYDGNIHKTESDFYTKVDFQTYDINLYDPAEQNEKIKTPLSYNLTDLRKSLSKDNIEKKLRTSLQIELHRRSALSVLCLIFALLGVGLGTTTNKRSGKNSGFVLCISLIVFYWMIYAGLENSAKSGQLPVWLAVWATNVLFAVGAIKSLKLSA